jgi:cytochrome P450
MRLLPTWMHPIASYLLPSNWRGWGYIEQAKKLLIPEIHRRMQLWDSRSEENSKSVDNTENNLLSWMMECAEGIERSPAHLAHLEIVVSLASIHTSQMNAVHVLYDLAAHPEYVPALREEILSVANSNGGWNKTSYSQLRRLDSFLKESQRFNPPSVLSYHRVMTQDYVLDDGTQLQKGNHIAMAVNAIQNDPEVTLDPEKFDAFRYSKMRERPGEGHLHQFATTESTMLNFGHGKNACPGRFFASLEIKVILVKLIMNYDFALVGGVRPSNLTAHEFIFPNPDGKLLAKARPVLERFEF